MSKAQMVMKEVVMLTLVAVLIFVLFKPIFAFTSNIFGVTSPTEKSFEILGSEVNRLVDSTENFKQQLVPMTLESEYFLIGFDKEYTPVQISDFVAGPDKDILEDAMEGISDAVRKPKLEKPQTCGTSACLCLMHDDEFKRCRVYSENIVFAGFPFEDPHKDKYVLKIVKQVAQILGIDELEYPMQNSGQSRPADFDEFTQAGFPSTWYEAYGYLYLVPYINYDGSGSGLFAPGGSKVSFGVRNVYVEKLNVQDTEYVLISPLDFSAGKEFADAVMENRSQMYESVQKRQSLIAEVKKLSENIQKDSLDISKEEMRQELEDYASQQMEPE
ncbi:MAG: hypothetical protein ACQESG_02835, partial [Nanobdellota archaeon]